MSKIFVQIASYRDPQLLPTINSILANAHEPEALSIAIAWQHSIDDLWDNIDSLKNDSRFKIIDINYKDSLGVCWARSELQKLYSNEEYYLQIDSHHRFVPNWDIELKRMLDDLVNNGYSKPLLTSYLPSFDPDNDPDSRVQIPWKMNFDKFIPEGAVFFLPAPFDSYDDNSKPLKSRFFSGHFAFSLGKFCKEVPYDPNYYFHGEEINMAVRSFTNGYDLFHPHKVIAWHEYTRKNRTKQWDDDKLWVNKNIQSHKRNRQLFYIEERQMDFGIYDFGTERTLKDYEEYAGLSFKQRSITQRTKDYKSPLEIYSHIDTQEETLLKIFKCTINLTKSPVLDDYDFWAIIFKDQYNNDIYRQDAYPIEINNIINNKSIIRQFYSQEKPYFWVVWPHHKTKGWLEPIMGQL